jgi:hypothetical protein
VANSLRQQITARAIPWRGAALHEAKASGCDCLQVAAHPDFEPAAV